MKVQLKVLTGSSAGKSITLAGSQFLIGRADHCQLRPNSESVSRQHCAITVTESRVSVRDLGSRNGTLVNGVRIEGDQVLQAGDELTVGPLRFEVVVAKGHGQQRPEAGQETKTAGAAETGGKDWLDDEGDTISQWFDEADETDRAQALVDPDTRVLKLDETGQVPVEEGSTEKSGGKKGARQKKPPAKLPRNVDSTKDTRDAAAQILKKLFNRG